MSSTDEATRAQARCESHPRRPAQFVCDSCGRPLCLTCAIPVRGGILGTECLGTASGREAGPDDGQVAGVDRRPAFLLTGLAFLVALVGTVLPWSAPNYSHYTGLFGGWGFSPPAWSLVAALGSAAGLAAWIVVARRSPYAWLPRVLPGLGGLCAVGTVLYLAWPPFATHPWLGPWVTLVAAIAATGLSFLAVREPARPTARAA